MQKLSLSKHWSLGSLQKLRSPLYPLHLSVINAKHELSRNRQGDPAIPHRKRDRKRMFRLAATFLSGVQMSLDSSLILGLFFLGGLKKYHALEIEIWLRPDNALLMPTVMKTHVMSMSKCVAAGWQQSQTGLLHMKWFQVRSLGNASIILELSCLMLDDPHSAIAHAAIISFAATMF